MFRPFIREAAPRVMKAPEKRLGIGVAPDCLCVLVVALHATGGLYPLPEPESTLLTLKRTNIIRKSSDPSERHLFGQTGFRGGIGTLEALGFATPPSLFDFFLSFLSHRFIEREPVPLSKTLV